jgi:hypothetical protein
MTAPELSRLVIEMREAQRSYFRSRSSEDLRRSKALEGRVDRACREVLDGPRVLPLFDPPEPEGAATP